MKKIMSPALLALAMAGTSAQAGEIGLLFDRQFGKAQAVTYAGGSTNFDATKPTGVGIRLGMSFLDLKFAELGAAITYHPKSKEDLKGINQTLSGSTPLSGAKYGSEYIAIGAQLDWKLLVNLHAGIDVRQEKYTTETASGSASTTQTRPWIKAGIGFGIPLPVVSPFVRLEVAAPFTKTSKTDTPDDLRKALGAEYQVALYGGIRF